jgi:hypothetical protein
VTAAGEDLAEAPGGPLDDGQEAGIIQGAETVQGAACGQVIGGVLLPLRDPDRLPGVDGSQNLGQPVQDPADVAEWSVPDMSDSRPPYLVVADRLRERIASGEFAPGSQLPSGKELAAQYCRSSQHRVERPT